jgi:hypothetical protein
MKKDFVDQTSKDYLEFLNSEGFAPSLALTEKLKNNIFQDLHPNFWLVLSKLALIHLVSAVVTLSLCPQFGFGLFGVEMGLMHFFNLFGDYVCFALCGAFFIGMTLLIASFLLRPEETRQIRKYWPLQISALILLSLGFFIMVEAEIIFGFASLWIFGSLFGGFAFMELGWWMRLHWR